MLEAEGRQPASIVLLDGSQSYVSGIIEGYKSRLDRAGSPAAESSSSAKAQEEAEVLMVFAMQFISMEAAALKKPLMSLNSWEERVNHVAKVVTQRRAAAGVTSQNDIQDVRKLVAHCLFKCYMVIKVMKLVLSSGKDSSHFINSIGFLTGCESGRIIV